MCGAGFQRARDLPGRGRDAPAGGRQQEAVHRRGGGLHGRAPVAVRRHGARAATQVIQLRRSGIVSLNPGPGGLTRARPRPAWDALSHQARVFSLMAFDGNIIFILSVSGL